MDSSLNKMVLSGGSLNGAQKAAALMLVMGKDTAVRLAEYFSKGELQSIYDAALSLPELGFADITELSSEFRGDFFNTTLFSSADAVTELFSQMQNGNSMSPGESLSEKEANGKKDGGGGGGGAGGGAMFEGPNVETLRTFFETERPLLSAFLLDKLEPDVAASALDMLETEQRNKIVNHLLNKRELDPEVEAAITKQLQGVLSPTVALDEDRQEVETAAMLINQISAEAASDLLEFIQENDAATANMVQKRLFRFENIELLTREERAKLFDDIQSDDIVAALFEASEGLRECILDVLSQRNRRMVEAELARSQPSSELVGNSKKKITAVVLKLAKEELIVLPDVN